MLKLNDLSTYTDEEVIQLLINEYSGPEEEVNQYEVLIAHQNEYVYDGDSWFLLRHISTGNLYEIYGSHCSCYGFEGQWQPTITNLSYVKSNGRFYNNGNKEIDEVIDGLG